MQQRKKPLIFKAFGYADIVYMQPRDSCRQTHRCHDRAMAMPPTRGAAGDCSTAVEMPTAEATPPQYVDEGAEKGSRLEALARLSPATFLEPFPF